MGNGANVGVLIVVLVIQRHVIVLSLILVVVIVVICVVALLLILVLLDFLRLVISILYCSGPLLLVLRFLSPGGDVARCVR